MLPGRMSRPWLSVVVPTFNEERAIAGTVAVLGAWLRAHGEPFEIIVVDNASTDGTLAALAPAVAARHVTVLANAENLGKGHSVRRGMLAARGALRLHCDADCAGSLPSLPAMLARVEAGADVVVGSRLAPGARVERRQPLRRRIVGRAFQELCRRVLGVPARDAFCGFKLWRAEAAEAVFAQVRLSGWVFDAEALALGRALGCRVEEVGIAWTDREGSRLSMPRVLGPVLAELLAARRHVASVARHRAAAVPPARCP